MDIEEVTPEAIGKSNRFKQACYAIKRCAVDKTP